jgi:hypothetical protein
MCFDINFTHRLAKCGQHNIECEGKNTRTTFSRCFCFMCHGNSARVPDSCLCYFSSANIYIRTTHRRNDGADDMAELLTVRKTRKSDPKYKHQQQHAWYVWRSGNSTSAFALTRRFKKTKTKGKVGFEENATTKLMQPSSSRRHSCACGDSCCGSEHPLQSPLNPR